MQSFDYVIYHRNCMDGFSSLLVAFMGGWFDPSRVWFHTIGPNEVQMPPHLKPTNRVLFMDLNMPASFVELLIKSSAHVTMVDHHTHKDYAKIKSLVGPKFTYVHDPNECAASLMWKLVFPNKPLPRFLRYIKDSDRATWEIKETQLFILGLEAEFNQHLGLSREMTLKKLEMWRPVVHDEAAVDELIKLGQKIKPFQRKIMEGSEVNSEIVEVTKPGSGRVGIVVCNGCAYLASKLAMSLAKRYADRAELAIVWYYNVTTQTIQCVVRSDNKDVLWLLEMYGASGHKSAGTFFFRAKHIYEWIQEHENRIRKR